MKICKTSNDGRHITIEVKRQHELIGESAVFKHTPSISTLVAIEDSLIYVMRIEDLETLIESNPNLAIDVIKSLGQELESSVERIRNLALDDTFTKVTRLISYLSKSHGIEREDSIELDVSLTRAELGSLIGTSRETVSRILNQLSREGILNIEGRNIKVLKRDKLEEWL